MNQENPSLDLPPYKALSALPSSGGTHATAGATWRYRMDLACSLNEMTRAEAQAHVMLQQRQCCVVREGARGPKGGHAKLHYNLTPEWPKEWVPNKSCRFFAVFGLTPEYERKMAEQQRQQEKVEHLALMYGTGRQSGKDVYQQAMLQSVKNGLGVMEIGQIDGVRYIESAWVDDEQCAEPEVQAPPRPRSEWWHK